MPFKRFVETGRVAYISSGRHSGKLCSIVDVIDQTRALVDGPSAGVPRSALRLNQLKLTKFTVKFPFTASTQVVRKKWTAAEIDKQWKESSWAKKLEAKKLRRNLSDFDRFKLRHARRIKNVIRTIEYNKLHKVDRRKRAQFKVANKGKKNYNRRVKKGKK